MATSPKDRQPDPENPITPDDYNPTHEKDYPRDREDLVGEKSVPSADEETYETDLRDEQGRDPSMRRTGQFIVPDNDEIAEEGWTLPTRPGGGWDQALDVSLEEQIEEPETPQDVNNK